MNFSKKVRLMISYVLVAALAISGMTWYPSSTVSAEEDWGIMSVSWSPAGDTGNQMCDVIYNYKEGVSMYSLYIDSVADDNRARTQHHTGNRNRVLR